MSVRHNMPIRLEVYTTRSTLYPEWWQFRRRYQWWRLRHRVRNNRKRLSPETQQALSYAEEALERELLHGDKPIARELWYKKLS